MSKYIPARKPAWVGIPFCVRPDFFYQVTKEVTDWLHNLVLPRFFLKPPKIIGALRRSNEISGHYLIQENSSLWVLHAKSVSAKNDLENSALITDYLVSCDILVTDYRRTLDNEVELESGQFVTLTRYYKARHVDYSIKDAIAVGVALAKLHLALSKYPYPEKIINRTQEIVAGIKETQNDIQKKIPSCIPSEWSEFISESAREYNSSFIFGDDSSQCLHGDLSTGNILYTKENNVIFCDFEDSSWNYRPVTFDIAMAVLRFGLEGGTGKDNSIAAKRAGDLINSYQKITGKTIPTPHIKKNVFNIIYHWSVIMTQLAMKHGIWHESEWNKVREWLKLAKTSW